ncbi:MAG TPA: DUF885 domain-containing protein [Gammaproteobacteria bacterium]|nr:DUF885 domain-containing protein [Gammaproteobacteria bacterium]
MDQLLSRREILAALSVAPTLLVLPACTSERGSAASGAREANVLALLDQCADDLLALFPEAATSLGVDTENRAALRSALTDRSEAGKQRVAGQVRADLARLDALDTQSLPFALRTHVEVVRSAYSIALEGFALPYGDITVGGWRNTPYVVIQNVGAYLDLPRFLDSDHPIDTAADAEGYLARLRSYASQLDGELGRIQDARETGLVPPAFLLDKTIEQMTLSVRRARAGGSLVESIVRRTASIPGNWAAQASVIAEQEVAPALERQLAELQLQRTLANDDPGISARPNGEAFYQWALKAATTTDMTPDEIHELGLAELRDLHAQMDTILSEVGYTQGSVGERMQALAADPAWHFAEGDPGRAEIMAFIDERLAWIRAQLPRAFETVVDPNMEVRRLPPEEEPGAPGAYGGAGSIDGSIPGRFWINLRTTRLHSRYSLADLTFHEAIPGHILQGEFTRDQPLIRQLLAFSAYSEGWALYAEQLADELGAYENNRVGRLGYLQSLAFRACRLVVDTGIHAKGWTRERSVRFFVEENGSNPLEVASEVDRYCSWPGQACGYKVGHSEINRQRQKAQAELGTHYDLRVFNETVVRGGNVPLDVLAANVDEYIRRELSV